MEFITDTTIQVYFFYVTDKDFNIEELGEILTLKPTDVRQKGSVIQPEAWIRKDLSEEQRSRLLEKTESKKRRALFRKASRWKFELEPKHSLDLNECFRELVDVLQEHVDEIKLVNKRYGITPGFEAVIEIAAQDQRPELYLDQSIVQFAGEIEAGFDIDWYFMYE